MEWKFICNKQLIIISLLKNNFHTFTLFLHQLTLKEPTDITQHLYSYNVDYMNVINY